jgi:hypothetical protein
MDCHCYALARRTVMEMLYPRVTLSLTALKYLFLTRATSGSLVSLYIERDN